MRARLGQTVVGYTRLGFRRSVEPSEIRMRATFGIVYGLFAPKVVAEGGASLTLWSLAATSEDEARKVLATLAARGFIVTTSVD